MLVSAEKTVSGYVRDRICMQLYVAHHWTQRILLTERAKSIDRLAFDVASSVCTCSGNFAVLISVRTWCNRILPNREPISETVRFAS